MEKLRNQGLTAGAYYVRPNFIGKKYLTLSELELTQVKNQVINEVKSSEYGENSISVYVSLDNLDLDLVYELRIPHVVKDGLTLDAHLIEIEVFNEEGDTIEIVNEEEIDTITIKLW